MNAEPTRKTHRPAGTLRRFVRLLGERGKPAPAADNSRVAPKTVVGESIPRHR